MCDAAEAEGGQKAPDRGQEGEGVEGPKGGETVVNSEDFDKRTFTSLEQIG